MTEILYHCVETLKDFGVNVSLIHLSKFTNPNKLLTDECDSYDLFKSEFLEEIFEKDTKQTPIGLFELKKEVADPIDTSTEIPKNNTALEESL